MHLLLLAAFTIGFGFAFAHQGSFDQSAVQDVIQSQNSFNSVALAAGSTLPANYITGAQDVLLINTANAPGTQTTRTAAQIFADLTQQLGFAPYLNYAWFLTISHQGTGTLTLAGGTGVTLGSGTNSVAAGGNRTYVCQLTGVGPNAAVTIQTYGSGSA